MTALNGGLLAGFIGLAWWQLGLFPAGMHEDDAYFYFEIARRIIETGQISFDGIGSTNGFHPLWMAVLSGAGWVFSRALPVDWALMVAAALPLIALLRLPPPVFAMVLVACYFTGFGMEGILGGVLFLILAAWIERPAWVVPLAALIVLTRVDFAIALAVFAVLERRAAVALGLGTLAGGLAYVGINLALEGIPYTVSALAKAEAARPDRLVSNVTSPGNLIRLAILAGALALLWGGPRRGFATGPLHLGLGVFLALHLVASPARDWYFAAPLIAALGSIRPGARLAPAWVLCLALPLAGAGYQVSRHWQDAAGYAAFLDALPGEGPVFAYDGSGYVAWRLHPRSVINGDGLVNTPDYARRHGDPAWFRGYWAEVGVESFLAHRGMGACPAPGMCCAPEGVETVAAWQPRHGLLASTLWQVRNPARCR
ncbi:MAG: hypothetical protein AAGI70_04955 [Pseudomonadota bacterium]